MEALAGVGLLAVVALWMVFMIPTALRYRSQLVAAHTDDRFSGGLKIVAGSDRAQVRNAAMLSELHQPVGQTGPGRSAGAIHATAQRPPVVGAAIRGRVQGRGTEMETSVTMPAAVKARRAAAARRRALLTVALLGITLGMIGASFATSMTMAAAAIPGALLLTVLVMGRRAVIANAKADARRGWVSGGSAGGSAGSATDVAGAATSVAQTGKRSSTSTTARSAEATTHTTVLPRVRPTSPARPVAAPAATMPASLAPSFTMGSDDDDVAPAVVDAEPIEAEAVVVADATRGEPVTATRSEDHDDAWQPVPTPRPTYVFKAPAPRREPRPLEAFDPAMLSAGPGRSASRAADVAESDSAAHAVAPSSEAVTTEPAATTLSGGLQLDAILARRRAIG